MNTSANVVQSANNEVFDFGNTSVPEQGKYLKLGQYWLSVKEAKFVKPEGNNSEGIAKTSFLEIVFSGKEGEVTEKFYVNAKEGLMKRLQYLHTSIVGKECSKVFKSIEEVGKYYETVMNDPRIVSKKLAIIVAGKEANNGKIYGCLPYLYFIVPEAMHSKFEEGEFEPGTANYINYLQKQQINASHRTDDVMLDGPSSGVKKGYTTAQVPDEFLDLPF